MGGGGMFRLVHQQNFGSRMTGNTLIQYIVWYNGSNGQSMAPPTCPVQIDDEGPVPVPCPCLCRHPERFSRRYGPGGSVQQCAAVPFL